MSDLLKDRIAGRIRDLRASKQLTQEEVARAIGVSTRHYIRWERGMSMPYWRNIEKLAEAFDVPADAIVNAEDSTIRSNPQERIASLTMQVAALEQKVEQLTRLLDQQTKDEQ